MSISLVLVPLAVALAVTVKTTVFEKMQQQYGTASKLEPMPTTFKDCNLLIKTLKEHGLSVSAVSQNQLSVKTGKYELHYNRTTQDEAFWVSVEGWNNADELIEDINCLEKEYKLNVQSYTYDKLMSNISGAGMTVEEEVILEDDSIMLTITVD